MKGVNVDKQLLYIYISIFDNYTLTRHQRKRTGKKPYECSVCKKAFFQSHDLSIHKRKHNVERPYKCFDCSKSFFNHFNFRRHTRTHANK